MLTCLPNVEHALCLCLLDTDRANFLLLQHLDPVEPRALSIDTTCIRHGNARTFTQPRSLIELSLFPPLPAVLVDCQMLTSSNKLVACGPSRKAAAPVDVFGKDPNQSVCALFVYRREGMMGFMLACGRVASAPCYRERIC